MRHLVLTCGLMLCGAVSRPLFASEVVPGFSTENGATPPYASVASAEPAKDRADRVDMGFERRPLLLAQGSRDALFGTDAAAEEKPNEEKPKARLSGFVEGLVAYNYADPSHWSRAVARLQVVGQGELAENVKWKLSGRVDGDLVYATSDFYLDAVKRDQRLDFFFKENYIDFTHDAWAFRIGAQQIVWGEVVGLFFADVVSARDMREFLLPGFDVIRIPQWAARAEYFAEDSHVEFIWIPVPVFDQIGKPGSDFYPAPLPSPTPQEVADLFQSPERPARSLNNANYGIRANTLQAGWDLAAFYYRSFSTQPTFYRETTTDPALPFVFAPRYDRIWQVGGTFSKDLGEIVLRGEAVYTHGQGHSVADLTAPESVVKRPTFDYIIGIEFSLPHDTRVNVQAFQRVFSGGHDDLAIQQGAPGASLFVSTKLTSTLEPQITWIQYFSDGGGLIRPRLNWHAAANLTVSAGVDIFTGPADGYFGRYNNRDRVYTEMRYAF